MAANIQVDSELMQHVQGAVAVPASRRFTAVVDEHGRPLLFSIGTDGVFYAIKSDGRGGYRLHNIGARLDKRGLIQAFAVSQATNGRLFIVFAQQRSNTDKTGDLFMLDLNPAQLDDDNDTTLRQSLLLTAQQPTSVTFERIHLGIYTPGTAPVLVAVFKNSKQDTDIARIIVDFVTKTWTWKLDLDLPENANKMLDLVPGKLRSGPGIFYLYAFEGKQSLAFITTELDEGRFYRVGLTVPQGVSSLATFVDAQGYTPLFVGGKGLHYFSSSSANRKNSAPVTISTSPMYDVVNNLMVAQSQNALSIWFENGAQALGYQEADRTKSTIVVADPVPLLPSGDAAEFTVVLDSSSKSKTLVVANSTGALTAMEQASDTRLWKKIPMNVPSLEANVEYTIYNTHIKITDSQGWPVANTAFELSCTGWVTATINGHDQTLGAAGVQVSTDTAGGITILVPTTDISSYSFYLHSPDSKYISANSRLKINPSDKVDAKLGSLTSGSDLQSIKFEDGTRLLDGSSASPDQLKEATSAIKQLGDVKKSIGTTAKVTPAMARTSGSQAKMSLSPWDAWHWVESKFTDAWNWVVEQAEGFARFVVKIGQDIWAFVLDTVEKINKAINFIIKKIGILWDQFVKWVGFIFNWGDIVDTAKSIVTVTNAALDYGEKAILKGADKIDSFFTNLQTGLTSSIGGDIANKRVGPSANQELAGENPSKSANHSAAANWSQYQFEHGGVKDNTQIIATPGGPTSDFSKIWTETLQPLLSGLEDPVMNKIVSDIINLFDRSRDIGVSEILKSLGTGILVELIEIFKKLAVGIVKIGALIIGGIRQLLNAEIKIPVIGPLFKKLMKGEPLTLLNGLALLLAMPVTVLAKLITGAAPKRLNSFDYDKMVNGGKIGKEELLAYNELASYTQIFVYMIQSIIKTYKIATAEVQDGIKALDPPTNMSFVLSIITKAITFPFDRELPGWPLRVTIWTLMTGNIFVKMICSKLTSIPTAKALAVAEAITGVSTFVLFQVVHGYEYSDTAWKGHSITRTTMNLFQTVFMLLGAIGSAYGQVVPEPIEKAICGIVVSASAGCVTIMMGGKLAVKGAEEYNVIVDGAD